MKKQKRQKYSNAGEVTVSKNIFENENAAAAIGAKVSNRRGLDLNAQATIQALENARLEADISKNVTSGDKTSRIGLSAQRQLGPVNLEGGAFTGTSGTGASVTGRVAKGPFSASHTESRGTDGRGSDTSLKYNNNNVTVTYNRNQQDGRVTNSIGTGWKGWKIGADRSNNGTGAFASYTKTLKSGANVNANLNKVPGSGFSGSVTYRTRF